MIIKQFENPRIKGNYERIVELTMTVDQFAMLRDCVQIAYENAREDSRMFEISRLVHDDFNNLKLSDNLIQSLKSR